jgi:hypothetical protein
MNPQRAANAIAARADRWERALAELHRIDAHIVARNGRGNGTRNAMHHAGPAEAYRRAAVAEGEAALWRATAEVLLLDREIWREHARRGAAMGRFSGDHYRTLRLLGSYPNGCSERLMVWHGVAVETMVDLIRAGLATAETIKRLGRGRPMEVARLKITEVGRRALRRAETPTVVPSLQRA